MAVEQANALVRAFLAGLLKRKPGIAAALMYVLALGRDVRANCWDLSEKAGLEPGDGRFHRLLGRYRWSWERGREMLPALAEQALGTDPDADDEIGPGLAIDETTDLKKGAATACVSPQHSGKTENCVTWVFSALVTATGQCWAWSGCTCRRTGRTTRPAARMAGSRGNWRSRPSRNSRSHRSRP